MDALGHRGVLGRQAERVPAHRMQHVEALRALVARDHVAERVVAHVAHVDAARRIGEHLEHVVFGPGRIVRRREGAAAPARCAATWLRCRGTGSATSPPLTSAFGSGFGFRVAGRTTQANREPAGSLAHAWQPALGPSCWHPKRRCAARAPGSGCCPRSWSRSADRRWRRATRSRRRSGGTPRP